MLNFENKVVVITGAGAGLGLEYAKFFAQRKAFIVLNDIAKQNGVSVAEIRAKELSEQFQTKVVPNNDSVEFGEKIIQCAIQSFGRIDVLINNAGILRDKSFLNVTDQDWELILKVHLTGAFKCTLAAWKYFRDQKYGRIINTSSGSGLFGNFGQVNYSTAKSGLVGFTKTLAKEGAKYNIKVNAIAPIAATQMTQNIMTPEVFEAVKPQYVVPLVGVLAHEKCPDSGKIFEVGAGWITELRLQRAQGVSHSLDFSPEIVLEKWNEIGDFSKENTYPNDLMDSFEIMVKNYEKAKTKNSGNKTEKTEENTNILPGKWQSEKIYLLMKVFVENNLAENAVKKCNASYQINLTEKPKGDVVFSFYIDLRQQGQKVGLGTFDQADATFIMTDDDFFKMCSGKLNPQMAYIRKQMIIKGNFKKASSFTPDLFPKPTTENLKKYSEKFGIKI